jgi:hypothetical protein
MAWGNFKRHNPIGLVKKHYNIVKNVKSYNHEDTHLTSFSKGLLITKK